MKKIFLALGLLVCLSSPVMAQTCPAPAIAFGHVLTAAQWNQQLFCKQATLGYTPLNKAGDTMSGPLITAMPSSLGAAFNLPQGFAPASPNNGDVWMTSQGLYYRANTVTYGPITTQGVFVFKVVGLNLNTTADQLIAIAPPTPNYQILSIRAVNPSVNFGSGTAPLGGIYTGASKSGFPLVAASQSYAGLTTATANTAGSAVDVTTVKTATLNVSTLYFSLSTPHGSAGTADLYIYVMPQP